MRPTATLWQIDISPVDGQPNRLAIEVLDNAKDLRIDDSLKVSAARGFLIQGDLTQQQIDELTKNLLVEPVVEQCQFANVGEESLSQCPADLPNLILCDAAAGCDGPPSRIGIGGDKATWLSR